MSNLYASEEKRFESLLSEIRICSHCAGKIPVTPRPILNASPNSRILIIGQAPGRRAHETGIAWNDASGLRLRGWLGLGEEEFYDPNLVAVLPMGFCYPGTGKSGDLPPRPECARLWHSRLLQALPRVELTLLVGRYAQKHYLADEGLPADMTLTETVARWQEFFPNIIPLPHPSPRNNRWLKKNPWFEQQLLPVIRQQVGKLLSGPAN